MRQQLVLQVLLLMSLLLPALTLLLLQVATPPPSSGFGDGDTEAFLERYAESMELKNNSRCV
jgi:hypothetical protein